MRSICSGLAGRPLVGSLAMLALSVTGCAVLAACAPKRLEYATVEDCILDSAQKARTTEAVKIARAACEWKFAPAPK
jgi:uncharacterized protein YgiB involved in biofilm formation